MNDKAKKIFIYIRYILPLVSLTVTLLMLFVPTHRFRFSEEWGNRISTAGLISNAWEQSRAVLFGAGEQSGGDLLFSRFIFSFIIISVVLLVFSIVVSVWSLFVAMKFFTSDDTESAEASKRTFNVFFPNRIALCICSSVGIIISVIPYVMKPLYAVAYSESVMRVLEAPDALIVGGVLVLASIILSVVCAPFERHFGADIFKKKAQDVEIEEQGSAFDEDSYVATNAAQNEKIRRLFANNEKDEKDNDKE